MSSVHTGKLLEQWRNDRKENFALYFRNIISVYLLCVGVMYSSEYDVCDVTLSVHPHRAS